MNMKENVLIPALIVAAVCMLILLLIKSSIYFDSSNSHEFEVNSHSNQKIQENVHQKQNISVLLGDSQTSDLVPRSLSNLDRLFGFRGLKMHMNINEIRFDNINTSNQYGQSFGGKWNPYESDLGYTSYFVDISTNSPYSLAGSSIQTLSLTFVEDELAQITMLFDLYELDLDGKTLKKYRYERLLNTLISTFGNPTIPKYSEFYTTFRFNKNQELPVEQELKTIKNEWKTNSIKMVLNNVLPNKKEVPGYIYHAGGSVTLVYMSAKYETHLNKIDTEAEKRSRKYYIEENLRMQIGDF